MSSSKNLIVPFFIPHRGCPHRCVFCNQTSITGSAGQLSLEDLRTQLNARLGPDTPHAVIAFYGGSFTGLPLDEQEGYLGVASEFVSMGHAAGVRLSTRPDYMDAGIAGFLKTRCVKTVELGVQSMDEGVLAASGRGHGPEDALKASEAVKSAGLELGIQVMAGLPGDTREKFIGTVKRVISLNPHFVRIYPLLVIKQSPLEQLWHSKKYSPLGLSEAVELCADAVELFREAGIKVVRVGLQPSKELEDALLAGPYHPSFGHLVESEIAYRRMAAALAGESGGHADFLVNPRELSTYKGIKSENLKRLGCLKKDLSITIRADEGVQKGGMRLMAS